MISEMVFSTRSSLESTLAIAKDAAAATFVTNLVLGTSVMQLLTSRLGLPREMSVPVAEALNVSVSEQEGRGLAAPGPASARDRKVEKLFARDGEVGEVVGLAEVGEVGDLARDGEVGDSSSTQVVLSPSLPLLALLDKLLRLMDLCVEVGLSLEGVSAPSSFVADNGSSSGRHVSSSTAALSLLLVKILGSPGPDDLDLRNSPSISLPLVRILGSPGPDDLDLRNSPSSLVCESFSNVPDFLKLICCFSTVCDSLSTVFDSLSTVCDSCSTCGSVAQKLFDLMVDWRAITPPLPLFMWQHTSSDGAAPMWPHQVRCYVRAQKSSST